MGSAAAERAEGQASDGEGERLLLLAGAEWNDGHELRERRLSHERG